MEDIKEKSIYHTVKGSRPGEVHHMEYTFMMGWMCSCISYMYRRSCKHIIEMNELMNEYGMCDKCKHYEEAKEFGTHLCTLWEFELPGTELTCAAWEEDK